MGKCTGNCESCSGCARELVLNPGEVEFLKLLGQIPFLPLARMLGEDVPRYPGEDTPENTLLLQCLHVKGLISLDYDLPLKGYDYGSFPIRGSLALTQRGQQVLELLELQGAGEE